MPIGCLILRMQFSSALAERCRAGLGVNVLLDAAGSFFIPGEYLPARLHAKTVAVDGVWATVGSTNFDNRSFALSEEVNVTAYDPGFARLLEATFEGDLQHARRVTYEAWERRGLMSRAREIITLPIRSQM